MGTLVSFEPRTNAELAEIVRQNEVVHVQYESFDDTFGLPNAWHPWYTAFLSGNDGPRRIERPNLDSPPGPLIELCGLNGIIEFSPDDQVVSVRGGTLIFDLNAELATRGQCIPISRADRGRPFLIDGYSDSVSAMVSYNYPHVLEAQCGSWRDWVLGMTLVMADGRILRTGSKAVKNVAGYDVHKLLTGARGTLGIVAEVTLRTRPLASLPQPEVEYRAIDSIMVCSIQRTLPSDFGKLQEKLKDEACILDCASCTAWTFRLGHELQRYPSDWLIDFASQNNRTFTDPTQIRLMKRAKEIFDPTGKLNPGEMGIF